MSFLPGEQTGGADAAISFTRPTDTTAYTAGDAIGINNAGSAGSAVQEFTQVGPGSGGSLLITDCNFEIDLTAVPSGMTTFRLHLYNAAPDAVLDNAAFDLSSTGDRGKYLGFLDLATPTDLGSTLYSQNTGLNKKVRAATSSIFGVIQTVGGYTPTSGCTFKIWIHAIAV